jgi:hypothetical protein
MRPSYGLNNALHAVQGVNKRIEKDFLILIYDSPGIRGYGW